METTQTSILKHSVRPLDEKTNEEDIIKDLQSMIGDAEEAASHRITEGNRNWQFVLDNQYIQQGVNNDWIINEDNPYWRMRLHRNILNPIVTTGAAVLHKLKPNMIVEADFPDGNVMAYFQGQHLDLGINSTVAAGSLQRVIEAEWTDRAEEIKQAEILLDTLVQGQAFRHFYPVWDGFNWRVKSQLLSAEQFLGDPDGCELETFDDFKYVIICKMMDVADIERIYHIKERDFCESEHGLDVVDDEDYGYYRKNYTWKPNGQTGVMERHEMRSSRRKYPVHTIFYHQGCPDIISYGEKPPKSLKFPLGRQMVLVNKRKLVADRHNPYWVGRFPLVCYQATPIPNMNFGWSDVSPVIPIQKMVNILQNMVLTNALVMGVPQWIIEDGAVDEVDITNEPGGVIHARPGAVGGGRYEIIEPSSLPPDLYNIMRDLQDYGKEELGDVSEALQGKSFGGNASGVALNTLLGAALTKQGFRAQMMDVCHQRAAKLELGMIQQYLYVDQAWLSKNHELGELLDMNLAMKELFFDVRVESQSDMPHNSVARINLGIQLWQLGIFDTEQLLLNTGINVRPELRKALQESSEMFIPAMPKETQDAIRAQLETARIAAEQGGAVQPGQAPNTIGPQFSAGTGESGEEISGTGPNQSAGPAGSTQQRVL